MFHLIEDSWVITRSKGIYRQVPAYTRNGHIYCKHGNGYIRLLRSGTSVPNITVESIYLGFIPEYTQLGYMFKPEK